MPKTTQDYHFPKAGVHVAGPYGKQPVRQDKNGVYIRTSADAANVRSYDPVSLRDRGGSRCGQSKYVPQRVAGVPWVVQELNTIAASGGLVVPVQLSNSGRVVYLLAVSQGQVKVATAGSSTWTAALNHTAETPPLNITGVMQSSALNQKMFFVDGTNYVYYDPTTNSVETWTPTAGVLPRDTSGNGCRLITTWRGRLVLSGLLEDPQNWFMCRISNENDLNYGPVPPTAGDAVAGNSSRFGLIGKPVCALIPLTDDILVMGCDSALFYLKGDPTDGGRIDLVSDQTGIAFGKAWCGDPYGNVYFFGNQPAVWRISVGQLPERISQPIEPRLRNIDTGNAVISMAWDHVQQSVNIYVTTSDEADNPTATTNFTWEYRTNSWWPDAFSNLDLNPLCVCEYDGNLAADRRVLLGGWDGYVRSLDPDASTDDGSAINSFVLLGPIMTQEMDEMLLNELQWILAEASGDITWEVLSGRTAEAALATVARASGSASAGRGQTQPVRVADHAIYVKLSSSNKWAMESLRTVFAGKGKVRRRN